LQGYTSIKFSFLAYPYQLIFIKIVLGGIPYFAQDLGANPIMTQNSTICLNTHTQSILKEDKVPLNMEKKNLKDYLRKLGWAGVIFFTLKGTMSLLFGAWLLQKLGC
jgi:hypothetical protein